ncbi:MAG TPA: phosphatidate cytidylyltransferase [Accumulibacter sp.]|uniref:Phosphatidate cytidylyltransferase n=1 Tax=Candidatus Accumulibacter cognatus TaxID=2954383 RepID=A0A080M1G7_9PROT|nr:MULTISPECIES: phosphatidate cytidylyltransferase [Candidatus Accumulibacter]KFB75117.1 MAG: Phosphatidate cytidylyltransferase [Candidatus Accumulibacter cognatus]MBN8519545.1 phosphatidate cytidylyltransferase [Accumulibacter sp.]MBO3713007.1 phosphatidate cytidylyltransferase [Accumulibacter sp.]MCC2866764.1 phosphatidate cytidylyltransferase [Candidatus Accumulibacter phosphatis]MCM8578202.1 phosphatidate cytidylyltransferase [Accumulibacter sp.]
MLRTRVITAIVLFAAFFGALFYLPPLGWLLFVTAVASIAAWEWGALMRLSAAGQVSLGVLLAVLCAIVAVLQPGAVGLGAGFDATAWRLGAYFYLPAAVFWLLLVPVWLQRRWPLANPVLALATGMVLLLPVWLALIQLRQAGPLALLAIMAIVWLADIGAYFAGRSLGKHKLAPGISPGKTWEGAIGGAVAVLAYGLLMSSRMPTGLAGNLPLLLLVLMVLTAISILGDLFESLLKRQAGLKDSSSILPGHGGVLDRIDSLTSTLPLVALVWLVTRL